MFPAHLFYQLVLRVYQSEKSVSLYLDVEVNLTLMWYFDLKFIISLKKVRRAYLPSLPSIGASLGDPTYPMIVLR